LAASTENPETSILDPETSEPIPWDWTESGIVEMNCFLCHTPNPNNEARSEALHEGAFKWANTATLVGTEIVSGSDGQFQWNSSAFDENGELRQEFVQIQDPTNDNCGQCHGLVHDDVEDPLVTYGCTPERWSTITTGQIVSPQRLSDSGMNLANKEELTRSWDVHAERLLKCTDCHYSMNNPLYYQEAGATKPDHLTFDPRRLEIGEYLYQPLHQFARGDSAQNTFAAEINHSMRDCADCHDTQTTHNWLPYKDRHFSSLSCQTCHVPQLFSSANQQQDWTVLTLEGSSRTDCRGVEGEDPDTLKALLTGYEPVLLPREQVDGNEVIYPHNLITSWFWVYGEPARPVRTIDLEAVYFEGDAYNPEVVAQFDSNDNGSIDDAELAIDTPEKENFIGGRLAALGLKNPRIVGEIQPYSIGHNVATGEWATQECDACHGEGSRLTQPIQLASYTPGGVMPEFVKDSNVNFNGEIIANEDGTLYYQPSPQNSGLYILGYDSVSWIDILGSLAFVGVLTGITIHGGIRVASAMRHPKEKAPTKRVYMYHVYERLWHWLQTAAIVLLLFTGLIIHKPDTFGMFSFPYVVITHNVLAAILAFNAAFSLFYHLASGEIQQYIPRPRGFFDGMITQSKYYIDGIFKQEEHPFEKTPAKKLNPLQQITYFGILNVLLPLQGITGILIWGAQRWPDLADRLGGLPFLSPFHTLIAWLFASFIVLHVYLTTTGHKPLTGIEAMVTGWEDMEMHAPDAHHPGDDQQNREGEETSEIQESEAVLEEEPQLEEESQPQSQLEHPVEEDES
jgi:thiosulfate reductase cytochrome b subunit